MLDRVQLYASARHTRKKSKKENPFTPLTLLERQSGAKEFRGTTQNSLPPHGRQPRRVSVRPPTLTRNACSTAHPYWNRFVQDSNSGVRYIQHSYPASTIPDSLGRRGHIRVPVNVILHYSFNFQSEELLIIYDITCNYRQG